MIIKPKTFDFQRNGISGNPFFTLVFDWEDLDKSRPESGENFIATFETDEEDQKIIIETCRIVNPEDPLQGWRGDVFAIHINETLNQLRLEYSHETIGDLQVLINRGKY